MSAGDKKNLFAEKPLSLSRRSWLRSTGVVLGGLSLSGVLSQTALAKSESAGYSSAAASAVHPIRVNYNENALGMSPKAQEAAREAIAKAFRYADAEVEALRALLAQEHGIPIDHILLTHGSGEGIRASMNAFSGESVQLVGTELTYGEGPRHAKNAGMKIVQIPHLADLSFDIEGMKKAVAAHKGPSVVYLVNPNNPTSTITPSDVIEEWIKSKPARTIFVVDEAYGEFASDSRFRSVAGLVREGLDNVVLLKTFSKIYAMAGMRIGYTVSVPKNIQKMSIHVGSEELNFCGACAAAASLQDKEFLERSKSSNATSLQIMTNVLDELELEYLPSQTNFIFHRVKGSLKDYQAAMAGSHILVGREFPPAVEWCRISMGTPSEMEYVARTMRELRSKGLI